MSDQITAGLRCSGRIMGLLLLALCTACTTIVEGRFNGAQLLPRQPVPQEQRLPGHVLLRMQPQALAVAVPYELGRIVTRVPAGAIVEGALLAALADHWMQGARLQAAEPGPATGASPAAATLVVEQVSYRHDVALHWVLPIPVYPFLVGNSDLMSRLSFDLSLLDAQGRTVWRRSYDSGARAYKRPSFWSDEPPGQGLVRTAHEQAWALAQQALADVRAWVADARTQERMQERTL